MIDYIKILRIVLKKINDTIKLHTNKLNYKFDPNKHSELYERINNDNRDKIKL